MSEVAAVRSTRIAQPAVLHAAPGGGSQPARPQRRATIAAALDEPTRANPRRDALSSVRELRGHGDGPSRSLATTRPARVPASSAADRVDPDVRRTVQAVGGAARGVATAGSGVARTIARSAPFRFGRVPGVPIVTASFALYDSVREFRRSGLGDETARTAAGGAGGVYGAFKGGAAGASIGAVVGGPVGAVIGGAAGAIIGGVAGSSVGQGVADGFAAARDVSRTAEAHDRLRLVGEVARVGVGAFGQTVWNGAGEQLADIAGGVADAAEAAVDLLDDITPW